MARRVLVVARDLVFRSKLTAVIQAAGASVTRDEAACDLAVVEIDRIEAAERVRAFVDRGVSVLAFGPHVQADVLRAAREAGASAVPNSAVEERLKQLLGAADPIVPPLPKRPP